MKIIESLQHPLIRHIRASLGRAHQRKKSPYIVLEGEHLARAYLEHCGFPAFFCMDASQAVPPIIQQALKSGLHAECVIGLSPKIMAALEDVCDSQGILAIIEKPSEKRLEAVNLKNTIVLDRIQDPGNVGTILRTAVSVGIQSLILLQGSASAWSPKVLRSAQGAHFLLDLYEGIKWQDIEPLLPRPLLATSVDDQAQDIFQFSIPSACTWIFGHEGQGVSADILHSVDHKVYIPQIVHTAFDSLNVGVAVGVCLFEQRRQRVLMQ